MGVVFSCAISSIMSSMAHLLAIILMGICLSTAALAGDKYYLDSDGDGFGNKDFKVREPLPGYVLDATDCNDGDGAIFPGAAPPRRATTQAKLSL